MNTFASKAIRFFKELSTPNEVPSDFEVINPYRDPICCEYLDKFLKSFFSDMNPRVFVLGINPGRFGSGQTGVPFTDEFALKNMCNIPIEIVGRRELSSTFIYSVIDEFGGSELFYSKFFLTALCPIGFSSQGRNCNYYDDVRLYNAMFPTLKDSLQNQHRFGATKTCVILGKNKNYQTFQKLNNSLRLFDKVFVLEHPRYIMQYRRKEMHRFVLEYCNVFRQAEK